LKFFKFNLGRDNGDFDGSEDQRNFATWRGQATKN
jgi:phenol hydroxylase P3 protein